MASALEFALGALRLLLDPRAWALILIAATVGFMKGCEHAEADHAAFMARIEEQGKAQAKWVAQRRADQKKITDRRNAAYEKQIKTLDAANSDLAQRLRERSGAFELPSVPGAAEGGNGKTICFDAGRLREGIREQLRLFGERFGRSVAVGGRAILDFNTCADWAVEQDAAAKNRPAP